jgi:hypothetical protein
MQTNPAVNALGGVALCVCLRTRLRKLVSSFFVPVHSTAVSSRCAHRWNWWGLRDVGSSTDKRLYRKNAIAERDQKMREVKKAVKNQSWEIRSDPVCVCWEGASVSYPI